MSLKADTASTRVALTGEIVTHTGQDTPALTARVAKVTGASDSGWLIVPLVVRDKIVGTMGLSFEEARPFDSAEITFYESVAGQLGVALERAALFEDLQESRRRVTRVLESISDGFYALDLIGKTLGEVLGDPSAQAFQEQAFAPAMLDGRAVEFERHLPQTDIWADIRVYPSEEGVAVYGRDITERRFAEEALRTARDRADLLATMLEESSQPFGVGTFDGSLGLVNRAFEELTGYDAQELAQGFLAEDLTPPEYGEIETERLQELLRTGEPVRYEKEYLRKDGTRVPVELLVHLASDEEGTPMSYYAFVTDLTERKERERLDVHFSEVRTAVAATLDFQEIIDAALSIGADALDADSAVTFTPVRAGWSVARSIGMPKSFGVVPLAGNDALAATIVAELRTPIAINDPCAEEQLTQRLVRQYRVKSILAAPLGVEGAEIGVLAFYHRKKHESFTALQLEFVARLARVTTLAIQNSMLYERERKIADTLQEALLTPPEVIAGIETSYLYRAASHSANVGGDFYDVFTVAEHHCAIVVGDVSGKGLEAARLTSLLHDGIRAYAMETTHPSDLLGRLNRLVCALTPPEQFATTFLGVLNTETGHMRYCTAGHPAPAVVSSNGARYLSGTRAPVLGAFAEAQFNFLEAVLDVGERLVLFTDGVTEARRGMKLLGEERLLKMLDKMTRTPVERLPQRLLDKVLVYSGGHLRDDTVILSLVRTESTAEPPKS